MSDLSIMSEWYSEQFRTNTKRLIEFANEHETDKNKKCLFADIVTLSPRWQSFKNVCLIAKLIYIFCISGLYESIKCVKNMFPAKKHDFQPKL